MALSPFLINFLKDKDFSIDDSSEWISDLQLLEDLPIHTWQDYKKFFYLRQHLPSIFQELTHNKLSLSQMKEIIKSILQSNLPIHNILNLYRATQAALENITPSIKLAYPEGEIPNHLPVYNIYKWIDASQNLKKYLLQNIPYAQSFNSVTSGWDKNEVMDFLSWLKYYQNMEHLKYKTAQNFLYDQVQAPALPKAVIPNFGRKDKIPLSTTERIEKSIRSILSRLNAAEKLSTNPEVRATLQEMLKGNLDNWLANLHTLKRQLQIAPWKVIAAYSQLNINEIEEEVSNSLLSNLIYREAAKIAESSQKASKYLLKLAQAITIPSEPIPIPPTSTTIPETLSEEEVMQEIISKMNPEVEEDENDTFDQEGNIEIYAQTILPSPTTLPQQNQSSLVPNNQLSLAPKKRDAEDLIEQALEHVTIQEIVSRLDAVAAIFRKREVPRQLAIIDLMMDKLNIGSFFPSLAEASQKSLDSNQYALTRIEDILSKLRGSLMVPNHQQVELAPEQQQTPIGDVQKILDQDAQKVKERDALEQKQELLAPVQPPLPQTPAQPITNVQQDLTSPQPQILR